MNLFPFSHPHFQLMPEPRSFDCPRNVI